MSKTSVPRSMFGRFVIGRTCVAMRLKCRRLVRDQQWSVGVRILLTCLLFSVASHQSFGASANSFVASKTNISKGDFVLLTWKGADNIEKVLLGTKGQMQSARRYPPSGSQLFSPTQTTTYDLLFLPKGRGPQPVVKRTLEVKVNSSPNIFRFYADQANFTTRTTIRKGSETTLGWDVYGADTVTLDGSNVLGRSALKLLRVQPRGSKTVAPKLTTFYTLKARSGNEVVEKRVAVRVLPLPPPRLSAPFKSVEIHRVNESGNSTRDIYFSRRDKLQVVVAFKSLTRGRHKIVRKIYSRGLLGANNAKRIHQEVSSFNNPKAGPVEVIFKIPNLGKGVRKLELVLDGKTRTKSEIEYCVECPEPGDD